MQTCQGHVYQRSEICTDIYTDTDNHTHIQFLNMSIVLFVTFENVFDYIARLLSSNFIGGFEFIAGFWIMKFNS